MVIKGILENIRVKEVKEYILKNGFRPGRIYRMMSNSTDGKGRKVPKWNVGVHVPKTDKEIINIRDLAKLLVKVETNIQDEPEQAQAMPQLSTFRTSQLILSHKLQVREIRQKPPHDNLQIRPISGMRQLWWRPPCLLPLMQRKPP